VEEVGQAEGEGEEGEAARDQEGRDLQLELGFARGRPGVASGAHIYGDLLEAALLRVVLAPAGPGPYRLGLWGRRGRGSELYGRAAPALLAEREGEDAGVDVGQVRRAVSGAEAHDGVIVGAGAGHFWSDFDGPPYVLEALSRPEC
jgi:hypothetical protein